MIYVTTPKELKAQLIKLTQVTVAPTIGFVPTMGYLHDGHIALIHEAAANNTIVVVSIFVNPIQFGKNEDFSTYPRDIQRDTELCKNAGVDILFCPNVNDIYPFSSKIKLSMPLLSQQLCGKTRKNHFDGVLLIVNKLFNLIQPNQAYFGLKDFQQYTIISQMVTDLNMPIHIIGIETIREANGLAMSSRNSYLTPENRKKAAWIYQAMTLICHKTQSHPDIESTVLTNKFRQLIQENVPEMIIEYCELVNRDTLRSLKQYQPYCRLCVAVYFQGVRLIDNCDL